MSWTLESCPVCGKVPIVEEHVAWRVPKYRLFATIMEHIYYSHGWQSGPFWRECPLCKRPARAGSELAQHLSENHTRKEFEKFVALSALGRSSS